MRTAALLVIMCALAVRGLETQEQRRLGRKESAANAASQMLESRNAWLSVHPSLDQAIDSLRCTMPPSPTLFPRRDDYAWEGLGVGAAIGLLAGIAINLAYARTDDRSVYDWVGASLISMAITTPVGALIGGAIPKEQPPPAERP